MPGSRFMAVSIFMLKKCVTSFFIFAQESKTASVKANAALWLRYERSFQTTPPPSTPSSSTERKAAAVWSGNYDVKKTSPAYLHATQMRQRLFLGNRCIISFCAWVFGCWLCKPIRIYNMILWLRISSF